MEGRRVGQSHTSAPCSGSGMRKPACMAGAGGVHSADPHPRAQQPEGVPHQSWHWAACLGPQTVAAARAGSALRARGPCSGAAGGWARARRERGGRLPALEAAPTACRAAGSAASRPAPQGELHRSAAGSDWVWTSSPLHTGQTANPIQSHCCSHRNIRNSSTSMNPIHVCLWPCRARHLWTGGAGGCVGRRQGCQRSTPRRPVHGRLPAARSHNRHTLSLPSQSAAAGTQAGQGLQPCCAAMQCRHEEKPWGCNHGGGGATHGGAGPPPSLVVGVQLWLAAGVRKAGEVLVLH